MYIKCGLYASLQRKLTQISPSKSKAGVKQMQQMMPMEGRIGFLGKHEERFIPEKKPLTGT